MYENGQDRQTDERLDERARVSPTGLRTAADARDRALWLVCRPVWGCGERPMMAFCMPALPGPHPGKSRMHRSAPGWRTENGPRLWPEIVFRASSRRFLPGVSWKASLQKYQDGTIGVNCFLAT